MLDSIFHNIRCRLCCSSFKHSAAKLSLNSGEECSCWLIVFLLLDIRAGYTFLCMGVCFCLAALWALFVSFLFCLCNPLALPFGFVLCFCFIKFHLPKNTSTGLFSQIWFLILCISINVYSSVCFCST